MHLFAVRVTENKEPVGFYFVRNSDELSMMVDSTTDPGECECLAITKCCAIIWPGDVDWKFGEADPAVDFTKGCRFVSEDSSEGLLDALVGSHKGAWKPIL
jgi:hypothetical protein